MTKNAKNKIMLANSIWLKIKMKFDRKMNYTSSIKKFLKQKDLKVKLD